MRSVAIIGAGPAGLTAARVLVAGGLRDVVVLERAAEPGGLPRFCGHPGWGLTDLHRIWRGPRYAAELVRRAAGAEIRAGVTVHAIEPGGRLHCAGPSGPEILDCRAVLLATGIRETPRGARGISGSRPWGVTTTGAFQEMVTAGRMRPFARPVVVGSELVAFSALLTARHAGIRPVALLEPGRRIVARRPGDLIARMFLGVPVRTGTRLVEILGQDTVEGVVIDERGQQRHLACDGVIFTGQFRPEAALARDGGLAIDKGTGGPAVDDLLRCSDPVVFAAGNVLRAVEHSGYAAHEGARAAAAILRLLGQGLPAAAEAVPVLADGGLRYMVPQRIVPRAATVRVAGRAGRAHRGRLRALVGSRVLAERRVDVLPERRITLDVPAAALRGQACCRIVLD